WRRVRAAQIGARADLTRMGARHGRTPAPVEPPARRTDAPEPTPPRREPALANGGSARAEPPRPRPDMLGLSPAPPAPPAPPPPPSSRRPEAPSLSPAAPPARGGWLSDLLTPASQDDQPPAAGRQTPPQ